VDDATNRANNKEYFANEAQKWLSDVNEELTGKLEEKEANFTTQKCGKSEELKVRHKVPEIPNNSTYSFNLLLS
jgi:hypothetical protein